jgi:hypothetical protein
MDLVAPGKPDPDLKRTSAAPKRDGRDLRLVATPGGRGMKSSRHPNACPDQDRLRKPFEAHTR